MPRFLRETRALSPRGVAPRHPNRAEKLTITGLEFGRNELRNNFSRNYTTVVSREAYTDCEKLAPGYTKRGL
jgi:hypothetical protein